MGQSISMLVTKEIIDFENLHQNQIYFKDNGYIIFPINLDMHEMEKAIEKFKQKDLLLYIKSSRNTYKDKEKEIIDLINHLKVDTFLLEHFTDHGSVTISHDIMIVKNGKVYKESGYEQIEDVLDYYKYGLEPDDEFDISKYHSYDYCETKFKSRS